MAEKVRKRPDLPAIFDSKCYYQPKRDGALDDFLQVQFDSIGTYRQFKGVGQFNLLWERGYLVPQFSCIRLMYNLGRGDACYAVIDQKTLSGLDAGFHSGEPGRHQLRYILTKNAPPFEAHHMEEDPEKRKLLVRERRNS